MANRRADEALLPLVGSIEHPYGVLEALNGMPMLLEDPPDDRIEPNRVDGLFSAAATSHRHEPDQQQEVQPEARQYEDRERVVG